MEQDLRQLKADCLAALATASTLPALEHIDQVFFSRKSGKMTALLRGLGSLSEEERKKIGQMANTVKQELEMALAAKRRELERAGDAALIEAEQIDVTAPKLPRRERGHLHPMTTTRFEMEDVARSMGFLIEDGPELESDYYNFTAVNIPEHHPARDSMDTFYVKDNPHWLMRTHVSNMQMRLLRKYGAPLRAVYPGRCFRNEATDPRHEHTFYQFEAIVVDRDISFADMVGIIQSMLSGLFKMDVKVRFRPKFYPFVEPGVNGEMTCMLCAGKGCRVCKNTGWLEIFGAGLVHPTVLREGGLDPKKWNGLAFGMGLSRLIMLKYGIEDTRHLQSGDLRFLQQF